MNNDNNNDNVLELATFKEIPEDKQKELERVETSKKLLEQAISMGPQSVVVIGINTDGHPFVMDSQRSMANVSLMTDFAKQLVVSSLN